MRRPLRETVAGVLLLGRRPTTSDREARRSGGGVKFDIASVRREKGLTDLVLVCAENAGVIGRLFDNDVQLRMVKDLGCARIQQECQRGESRFDRTMLR